ncbi:Fic family protein [Desulfocastanea catecholica]
MENQQIEYKKSFGKDVIISLVAFANSEGGKVMVGVLDNGELCGVHVGPETIQRYINEIKTSTYPQLFPSVKTIEKERHAVLLFEINEYPVKPVAYKNRYYKRVHNSNHLLSLEEIVDLQQQSLAVSFDAVTRGEQLNSLDLKLIEHFFARVNERGRVELKGDVVTNLKKLNLVRDEKITFAAHLLFGNPDTSIRIGRFKSKATIIDDIVLSGPLYPLVDEAMTHIKKHINLSYHFDGSVQRKERWQYPLEVIRELLLNSIVHRDYKYASDIIVKIFDDKIEFTNPGTLFGRLSIADLQRDDYVSSLRNRLIAEVFYLTGDIERYGTGFVRIREFLKDYPEIVFSLEEVADFFRVVLQIRDLTPQVTPQGTPQVTPQVSLEVLRLLRTLDRPLSRQEIQSKLGLQDRKHLRQKYLLPALEAGLIELAEPDKPNSPRQKYLLSQNGRMLLEEAS